MYGIIAKGLKGWDYLFGNPPSADAQAAAQRATLQQFQSYPANEVQGRGTMVTQNGVVAGKYWSVVQPPQVYADHRVTTEGLLGAGTQAGGIRSTPLVPNSNDAGLS